MQRRAQCLTKSRHQMMTTCLWCRGRNSVICRGRSRGATRPMSHLMTMTVGCRGRNSAICRGGCRESYEAHINSYDYDCMVTT